MFAYCLNNPINRTDANGNWSMPNWAKKLTVAATVVVAVVGVAAITVATAGTGTAAAIIACGAAKGAAIGFAAGATAGAGNAAIKHRLTNGSWQGVGDAVLNGMSDGALTGAITGAITGAYSSTAKVVQAAKTFDKGTFSSGYKSMKYHYNKHVIKEGLSGSKNILQYADDAQKFASKNASILKYTYNYRYNNASWNFTYTLGQGGMYNSAGKTITFWYR